jgi:hypothetical protein
MSTGAVRGEGASSAAAASGCCGRRERWRSTPEGGAKLLVGTPATHRAWAGSPVACGGRTFYRPPQGADLSFGGKQVGLIGLVSEHLAATQIDQLQEAGHLFIDPPEHQRVEPHLEHGPLLEPGRRSVAGLVVDHPQLTGGGSSIEPVDVSAEQQPGLERGLDIELALSRLEAAWIL